MDTAPVEQLPEHPHGTHDLTAPPVGAVRELLRWYRPYLHGLRPLLTWVTVGTTIVLACQALIPWFVELILHSAETSEEGSGAVEATAEAAAEPHWPVALIVTLLALVVIQLSVGYFTHIGAHRAANESAVVLRSRLFERMLRSDALRQRGLRRSAVVMRLTVDVDRISDAVEETLATGIPGLARLIISLALLTVLEWRAGIAMTIATIVFVLIRRRLGRRLLLADRNRLLTATKVGESVDETISTARSITGLHLTHWQVHRFEETSEELEHRTHRQGIIVTRLITAAHAAALAGLVVVVIVALIAGGNAIASVAAALLYVESAVRGMESLPPWIRSVQLAAASQRRVDDILFEPDRIAVPAGAPGPTPDAEPGLALESVTIAMPTGITLDACSVHLPLHAVVGLVTPPGEEPDDVLGLLSGDVNPESGRVTIDGVDVREPSVAHHLFYVPDESDAIAASAGELLRAVAPTIDDAQVTNALEEVGLQHVLALPRGIHQPLGPGGVELTVNEQQRLMLAIALVAKPRVLLVGSLLAVADVDNAMPVIAALRNGGQESTVIAVRNGEVAEAVDVVLFVSKGTARLGTHQQLLVEVPAYSALWEQRLATMEVDLSVVGIDSKDADKMLTRLVTEHYAPGDLIYRQGSPADRILFIISGHVEIATGQADGSNQRVAVLGPGNHCGDLRLTVGETRAESAIALDDCVVRSLSRNAIQAGLTGLLDRTPTERRIVESILRNGSATREELAERLVDVDESTLATSLALLIQDGALQDRAGVLSAVLKRAGKSGAADLLDRLGGL